MYKTKIRFTKGKLAGRSIKIDDKGNTKVQCLVCPRTWFSICDNLDCEMFEDDCLKIY